MNHTKCLRCKRQKNKYFKNVSIFVLFACCVRMSLNRKNSIRHGSEKIVLNFLTQTFYRHNSKLSTFDIASLI